MHSSLKQKGRRPASILAGRAVYFRRLAASRHRSFPCSTHSCLDFTRVHITVYQRGCISFFLLFLFFSPHFAEYKPNGSRKNKYRFCSAMRRPGGQERERGDMRFSPPAPRPDSLAGGAEGFSWHGFGNGSWRGHGGIGTPEGRRSRRGSCIPAQGVSSLSGGIEMFGQHTVRVHGSSRAPRPGRRGKFWLAPALEPSLARGG